MPTLPVVPNHGNGDCSASEQGNELAAGEAAGHSSDVSGGMRDIATPTSTAVVQPDHYASDVSGSAATSPDSCRGGEDALAYESIPSASPASGAQLLASQMATWASGPAPSVGAGVPDPTQVMPDRTQLPAWKMTQMLMRRVLDHR